jgi:hypothetical protein
MRSKVVVQAVLEGLAVVAGVAAVDRVVAGPAAALDREG